MQVIEYAARKPVIPETVRVAAYARVSSDKDTAEHSLDAQKEYYENYIKNHLGWNLVNVYYDEAISGTKNNRPAFQKMLEDCRAGKIDKIITKTISRFARNTVTLASTIRELKTLGVEVYFENENLSSFSGETELLLTLLAIFAEEEARSNSQNQLWKIKKRFEQGKTTVGRMLGYRLVDGVLTIVPEEAEIVRIIFQLYYDGFGISRIARELNRLNIKPPFAEKWYYKTLSTILTNEKYTGDMLLQKTYVDDFRTKKKKYNHGERPQYYVENSHKAIIDKEMFTAVQKEMEKRRKQAMSKIKKPQKKHLFAGLIKCGICGASYIFRLRNTTRATSQQTWMCQNYNFLGKDVCDAKQIREEVLIEKTKDVLGLSEADELTRELILNSISSITVNPNNEIVFYFRDGSITVVNWQNISRRKSWTPEMKEEARRKTLERRERIRKEIMNALSTEC